MAIKATFQVLFIAYHFFFPAANHFGILPPAAPSADLAASLVCRLAGAVLGSAFEGPASVWEEQPVRVRSLGEE